jgi:hypothetical protein
MDLEPIRDELKDVEAALAGLASGSEARPILLARRAELHAKLERLEAAPSQMHTRKASSNLAPSTKLAEVPWRSRGAIAAPVVAATIGLLLPWVDAVLIRISGYDLIRLALTADDLLAGFGQLSGVNIAIPAWARVVAGLIAIAGIGAAVTPALPGKLRPLTGFSSSSLLSLPVSYLFVVVIGAVLDVPAVGFWLFLAGTFGLLILSGRIIVTPDPAVSVADQARLVRSARIAVLTVAVLALGGVASFTKADGDEGLLVIGAALIVTVGVWFLSRYGWIATIPPLGVITWAAFAADLDVSGSMATAIAFWASIASASLATTGPALAERRATPVPDWPEEVQLASSPVTEAVELWRHRGTMIVPVAVLAAGLLLPWVDIQVRGRGMTGYFFILFQLRPEIERAFGIRIVFGLIALAVAVAAAAPALPRRHRPLVAFAAATTLVIPALFGFVGFTGLFGLGFWVFLAGALGLLILSGRIIVTPDPAVSVADQARLVRSARIAVLTVAVLALGGVASFTITTGEGGLRITSVGLIVSVGIWFASRFGWIALAPPLGVITWAALASDLGYSGWMTTAIVLWASIATATLATTTYR